MRKTGRVSILLLLLATILPSLPSFAVTRIMNIRHWTAPDHTRVVLDTSGEAGYRLEKSGDTLILSLGETRVDKEVVPELVLNKPGISRVAIRSLPARTTRVELHLRDGAETKVFALKKLQDKPDRLVIDIWLPDVEKKQSEERTRFKTRIKERIVVIDPGHGGEDPGAIGKRRTREKDVVLSISRKLRDTLNRKKGYHAFLTRDGDYYVSFKKRLQMAREYGADLFISVHADAARSRAARGSSVYCLSLGGASSEAAKILARNENLADIIGGSENGTESDESGPIVLNMFQTNTINQSKTFGYRLLRNLRKVIRPKSRRVHEAPFKVLKLPEVPALLLETAYISNPREEKLLRSRAFQTRLARAVAHSITEFLPLVPPPALHAAVASPSRPEAATAVPQETAAGDAIATVIAAATPTGGESGGAVTAPLPKPESATAVPQETAAGDAVATVIAAATPTGGESGDAVTATLPEPEAATAVPQETAAGDVIPAGSAPAAKTVTRHKGARKRPPVGRRNREVPPPPADVYRVRRGDSLARIAARHGTTLGALLKLNRMKLKDPLYVGRVIILRKREMAVTARRKKTGDGVKPASSADVYRVRRGDSLAGIAARHGTTLGALLKLNRMKLKDPLYVGRVIILKKREKPLAARKGRAATKRDASRRHAGKGTLSKRTSLPATTVYRVKRGDTLAKVASKHKTTIGVLLKLNRLRRQDPLYVDQTLILPPNASL